MRKLIDTIKNIWNIEDLRNRILVTLGILAIYRFGSFVVIPGVDPSQLSALHSAFGIKKNCVNIFSNSI